MFKSQFLLMIKRHEFQFSLLFVMFIAFIYPIILVYQHLLQGKDIGSLVDPRFAFIGNRYSEIWYYMYYYFPLILMFPFAYSYAVDKRTHYDCVLISRGGIKKYFYAKAFCCMIGGFIITFTPSIVNVIVNYLFLPPTSNDIMGNSITEEIMSFANQEFYEHKSQDAYLWLVHPKICFLFSSFRIGVLGATFSLVIYVISMMIKNLRFFYFSVVPVLLFFVISHRAQENIDSYCVDVLEYAFAGSYLTLTPIFFWLVCLAFIILSFITLSVFAKKDQI